MFKCSIERINNGFILREDNEDEEIGKVIVFEDGPITSDRVYVTNDFEEEIVPLQKIFYCIMDFFGIYNSKHEKKALDISIVDRNDFPIEDTIKYLKEENKRLKENIKSILEERSVNKCQEIYPDKSLCCGYDEGDDI